MDGVRLANLVVAGCAVPCRRECIMLVVTSGTERPRWWFALRSGAFFLVGGGLGVFTYGLISHDTTGALPWGGLLLGTAVAATLSALFPRRQDRRV